METKTIGWLVIKKIFILFISLGFLFSVQTVCAQDTEGTPIQKDLYMSSQISSVEDLPDGITISLYDSESATAPIATQAFQRGQYALDFEFNKSDGLSAGPIARLNVNFTNKLYMGDDPDNPNKVEEIWAEVRISEQAVGDRTKVKDETLVRLLLASDASIATYLTLAYEGDGNPITTIYKDLPLASGSSANEYITSMFSSSASSAEISPTSLITPFWELSGSNIFYPNGNVGIVDTAPNRDISVKYSSTSGGLSTLPTISVANTNTSGYSFASYEFSGGNGAVVGEFFADGSGLFLGGTPSVYFRASTDSPMLLGTNKQIRFAISNTGNVGIGLGTTMPSNALDVFGTIRCKELIVTSAWADFVFEDNYKLPGLDEVENFISKNKHLPGIPSEAEVKEKGVSVGSISSKLLQKIEELTLYVIDLKKENDLLKGQISNIQYQLDNAPE